MRIIDSYINKSVIKSFFLCAFIFSFLFILIDTTDMLDEIRDRGITIDVLVRYYLAYMPIIFVQISSFSCLLATLLTFSQMHTHNELIAMRASGLNFWQMTKPALIFAMAVSITLFYVGEKMVPEASARTKQIREESMILQVDRDRKKTEKIKNLTFYGLKNRLYFVDSFDPKNYNISGITIIEFDETQNIKLKIVAYKGVWTGIAWKFYECHVTTYDAKGLPEKMKIYTEKLMDIKETPKDFLKQRINVSMMNLRQLNNYIKRFANSGATRALNNLRVDLHQKMSYPFGNFVIILTGLPFVMMIQSRKRSVFTAIGLALMIAFLYYVVSALSLAFGKGGLLSPALSAWIAPVIFSCASLVVIRTNF